MASSSKRRTARRQQPEPSLPKTRLVELGALACDLVVQGWSWVEIARELSSKLGRTIGPDAAFLAFRREMDRRFAARQATAEHWLQVELERLDACVRGVWSQVQAGEPAAVRALVAVSERKAKLLGLDKAQRTELSGPNGGPLQIDLSRLSDAEVEALARGDVAGFEAAGGGRGRASSKTASK